MNHFTCTLTSGLGVLIRDTGFQGLRFANFSCQQPLWEGHEGSVTSASWLLLRGKTRTKSPALPAFLPA